MRLELGEKKNTIIVILAVAVIVIAVGWILYSQLGGGGGSEVVTPSPEQAGGQPPAGPGPVPPGTTPPPGGAPPGVPPGAPPAPGAAAPPAGPQAAPPQPAPSAPAPSAPAAPPSKPAAPSKGGPTGATSAPTTITVFGSLVVSYPAGWGIGAGSSGSTAVITDGRGVLEVRAPSPKATDAKSIASAAVAQYAKGASVTAQGPKKIAGYDSYYLMVKGPMGITRITGIDAPTRVVLVEYVKGGQFAAYKSAFDNLESHLRFK